MKRNLTFPLLALAWAGFASPVSAASVPYTNNFDGTGSNVAFTTELTDAAWTVGGGSYNNSYVPSAVTVSSAANRITGISLGIGDVLTTSVQFNLSSVANYGASGTAFDIGIGAFGNDTVGTLGWNVGTGANLLYADFLASAATNSTPASGTLRLRTFVGATATQLGSLGSADANLGNTNLAVGLNTTYTLRLTTTKTGATTYSLSFGLFDSSGTTQIGTSATATGFTPVAEPGSGYFFGLRTRSGLVATTASTVAFDNFNITAVPEPSTYALGAALLGLFAIIRRRMTAKA